MDERRSEPRVPVMAPIEIAGGGAFHGRAGVTEDRSAHGLRLRTTAAIPVGTRLEVRWTDASSAHGVVVRAFAPSVESLFRYSLALSLEAAPAS